MVETVEDFFTIVVRVEPVSEFGKKHAPGRTGDCHGDGIPRRKSRASTNEGRNRGGPSVPVIVCFGTEFGAAVEQSEALEPHVAVIYRRACGEDDAFANGIEDAWILLLFGEIFSQP